MGDIKRSCQLIRYISSPSDSLVTYLLDNKIDDIEDDNKFIIVEYLVVQNYCEKQKYKLSDEDIETLKSRGLYDSFLTWESFYKLQNILMNERG